MSRVPRKYDRINGQDGSLGYNLLINGGILGLEPTCRTFDPNFQRDFSRDG